MGVCCNCNKTERILTETQFSRNEDNISPIFNFNNNITNLKRSNSEEKQNIIDSDQQLKAWSQQKDTLINKNSNKNIDKPDIIDEIFMDNNKFENSINTSALKESEIVLNLTKMEKNLFELINELRINPESFIDKIEQYKEMLETEDDTYYITLDDNQFEFRDGKESFDECIKYLRKQKNLKKFEKTQSMFECKQFFVDKNVSDLIFVVVYNLIDPNSDDKNKIKRNCIMSQEYNKLNITIAKDELTNNLYSYYFSFDNF